MLQETRGPSLSQGSGLHVFCSFPSFLSIQGLICTRQVLYLLLGLFNSLFPQEPEEGIRSLLQLQFQAVVSC